MKKRIAKFITAAVIIAAVIILIFNPFSDKYLILEDDQTGEIYTKIPVENLDEFEITFTHSVNKTPVTDIYQIREGDIYLTGNIYYSFGAGVPTEIYEGQTLSYGENGEMIISDMDTLMPNLVYIIGTVTDYYLSVNGGEKVCLQDLYGTNKHIRIYCRGFLPGFINL